MAGKSSNYLKTQCVEVKAFLRIAYSNEKFGLKEGGTNAKMDFSRNMLDGSKKYENSAFESRVKV